MRDDHHHPQEEEEGGGVVGQENLVRTSVNFRESPVDCGHRQDGWGCEESRREEMKTFNQCDKVGFFYINTSGNGKICPFSKSENDLSITL